MKMEWKWNPKLINYLTNMCQSGQGTAVILFPLTGDHITNIILSTQPWVRVWFNMILNPTDLIFLRIIVNDL
jgi:hypothetical protein